MRANKLSVLLTIAAVSGPWLLHPAFRQQHAAMLLLACVALIGLSLLLKRPFRAEHMALPVLLLATCPASLLRAIEPASRRSLLCVAIAVLLAALVWRVVSVWRRRTAGESLLDRAFPALMPVARAELALFRFGLLRWRRRDSDVPAGAEAFPATATGTELAMCWLTAGGFVVETPMMHLLLAHLSGSVAAWCCTGLHAFLAIYLIGYAKSLLFRPTLLFADRLEIRLGVVARRVVPRAAIERAILHAGARTDGERLFGLDEPNVRLGVAGRDLLLRVDAPKRLIAALAA